MVAHEPDSFRVGARLRYKEVKPPSKVERRPDMLPHSFPRVRNCTAPGCHGSLRPGSLDEQGDRAHTGEERGAGAGSRVENEDGSRAL